MKLSRKAFAKASLLLVCVAAGLLAARAAMPEWVQNIEVRSLMEAAIFRTVPLPTGPITIRRPPAESVPALGDLVKQHPQQADLYSLKALEEEQKLDFTAAEADWKLYLQNASDKAVAQISLADFYHRRHQPKEEVNALSAAARMPSPPSERFTPVPDQRSWQAFERSFQVIQAQALGRSASIEQYNAWIARYPQEPGLYGRYFEFLLNEKDFKGAAGLIAKYHAKFPDDEVFTTKARALLAYKQGSVEEGLAVYEKNFQPLWPPELIKNYFDLVRETRSLRSFLDQAHAALARNPDDLNAAARVFYYYQQQGNLQAAQQAITDYRLQKDARKAAWTAQELYTFARLLDAVHLYPEAARYYFALYNSPGADSPEKALAGLANILLIAPEQQIRFGAGDISMYKDIASMDTGPGYLNGILSLVLNTSSPASHYSEEEQRALPYFHRSRAAEFVALFDKRFPNSATRPELHARLIEAYANYGEDAAVLSAGSDFMAAFPAAPQRNQVALLMADSYARGGDTKAEFALYDTLLQELARKADGVPLGDSEQAPAQRPYSSAERSPQPEGDSDSDEGEQQPQSRSRGTEHQAFSVQKTPAQPQTAGVRSPEYQRVLDRYISRLVSLKQIPAALAVWRQELDRNPNDPGLYEKFAVFLEGNQLGTEEEAIYKRAIQQFPGTNWYYKLARWYLRKKRDQDLQALSQQVLQIFSGSDLEAYLRNVSGMPEQLDLRFNQLAHERFPHNLTFVHNLLNFNRAKAFYYDPPSEALLRQYWFADEDLRNRFFEFLSHTGKLEAELQALRATIPANPDWSREARSNPANARFIGEAELWRSHFEAGAPVIAAVARQYPADAELGERASSVYRSLAYFDPRNTEVAVEIETNLLRSTPGDRERLARIGDIYSDHEQFAKASPFWNRMPETEPGRAQSYEDAATVFWDYYFFEDALRLLNLGRTNLHDETLYSYQVGAIYENKRDYPRAVDEYVKGALATAANAGSRERLLQLATRKPARDAVDAATDRAVVAGKYELGAIQLRVEVLEAQGRKQDLPAFLLAALDHSSSVETLESIEQMAREKSLEAVRQHALERQAAVSTDPIRRLELRYALVSFYEQKKDLAAAQQNVEALYKENPKVLGVVRSTVDFYWRNKLQQRAIDVLAQAAKDSYPALRAQFTFEESRKMTDAGELVPARKLLLALLADSSYNSEYLAAAAETYARAGDNAGLRDFYLQEIKLFQKAALPADERKDRIAALRRGLIPALTAVKDYAGGVDQYIEIINAYPEDAGLTGEAAYYAQRHQRQEQLLGFYAKTVAASPRDSRWAVVLARLQASLENFDAAIRTYGQAIKVRPDRTDLLTARAAMEERLMRFDEAAADYASLYELAYHDARWMEKVAEIRARQNKPEQAVQALKTAMIDGRPEAPGKYFTAAGRFESWGMLAPAREYAEKGVALAGNDLLANSDNHAGAQAYTRIMTRLRQQEAAYQKLQTAMAGATQLPSLAQQVAKNGIEAVTNTELRKHLLSTRTGNARNGLIACVREMGTAVNQYFTPEERVAFTKSLEARNAGMTRVEAYDYLLPVAEKAGIVDLQVKLMTEELVARPTVVSSFPLEQLQTRRLKLMELGKQLEQIGVTTRSDHALGYLMRSLEIYGLAGSPDDELRVLEEMKQHQVLGGQHQNRYFELLLAKNPQQLVQLAGQSHGYGDAAVNFLIAHADAKLAFPAVEARSASEPAVWRSAYTALTGLYFSDGSLPVQNAFTTALADGTIGQRLSRTVTRKQGLAGDVWFYYGSRYGEYLGTLKKGDPEDFLPAEIEHTPTRASAYFSTALYYEDSGDLTRAVSDYQHVLELTPERIDVHNRLAGIYWKQKHQDQALAEWKRALELLKVQTTTGKTQETFWGDFAATINNLASRKLLPQFQADVNEVLHNYVKRNGTYRVEPLMRSVLPRLEGPAAATTLVLELSTEAPEKISFLRQFVAEDSTLKLDQEPVYRRLLELEQEKAGKAEGVERELAQQSFEQLQVSWLQFLLDGKQYDRVRSGLSELPRSMWERQTQLFQIQLKMAAQSGGLDAIVDSYSADPEHAPSAEVLRKTATELQQDGDKQSARKILEFVFTREIENRNLTAANMLGLADIRLQAGDLEGGVALLRRMALVVGDPFETQDQAAALLMRAGHPAEAMLFLEELAKAVPWNADYRVRLAQARIAAKQNADAANKGLVTVASAAGVSYETRLSAAKSISIAPPDLGSKELNLMVEGQTASANDANQPYFFAARLKAAESLPAAARTGLLRAALEDNPAGEAARVPLLKAATETGDYYLAIATMKPYLAGGNLESAFDNQQAPEEEEPVAEDWRTEQSVRAFAKLPAKERTEISRDLGIAFEKTNALTQALPYLRKAYRLETDPSAKTQINKEVQQIRLVQRRRAANRVRQPDVHSELEQEHVVRPRLPEPALSTPPGPQSPTRKGAGL